MRKACEGFVWWARARGFCASRYARRGVGTCVFCLQAKELVFERVGHYLCMVQTFILMNRKLFLATAGAVLLFVAVAFQNAAPQQSEKFVYCHVSISGGLSKSRMTVDYGDGNNYTQVKGDDGKQIVFSTMSEALNHMGSQGWELVAPYAVGQQMAGTSEFLMKKSQ